MTSTILSLGQLESHLWEAANILRGPVDAADFKTYVFPLLFFKRISDVHDEEYAAALASEISLAARMLFCIEPESDQRPHRRGRAARNGTSDP